MIAGKIIIVLGESKGRGRKLGTSSGPGIILALLFSTSVVSAQTYEADVVVIGGGGAGLAAAVSAAENGASVILIEKAPFLGGNTLLAGGAYNLVDPARQSKTPMNSAPLTELKSYLDEDPAEYGDFGPTLVTLQNQIREYLESGNTDYLFDSVELHMIQTYLGGKRIDRNGYTITGNLNWCGTRAKMPLGAPEWLEGYGLEVYDGISTVLGALWPRTRYGRRCGLHWCSYNAAQQNGVPDHAQYQGYRADLENGRGYGIRRAGRQHDYTASKERRCHRYRWLWREPRNESSVQHLLERNALDNAFY